jgi:hypothetical protein
MWKEQELVVVSARSLEDVIFEGFFQRFQRPKIFRIGRVA